MFILVDHYYTNKFYLFAHCSHLVVLNKWDFSGQKLFLHLHIISTMGKWGAQCMCLHKPAPHPTPQQSQLLCLYPIGIFGDDLYILKKFF